MGRAIWIYKLNQKKVSNGLQKLKANGLGFNHSFQHFLESRGNETLFDFTQRGLNIITPNLLFEINYWLSEVMGLNEVKLNQLLNKELGASLLFESSTKSEANAFMYAYYNYLDTLQENKVPYEISEGGISTNSVAFDDFLDYFILLLNKINFSTNGNVNYTLEIKKVIDQIATKRAADVAFMKQLNLDFDQFLSLYQSIFKNSENFTSNSYPEFELIRRNYSLLSRSIEIREMNKNQKGDIIIIDSK